VQITEYNVQPLAGIGKKDRALLSVVLRELSGIITVADTAILLGLSRSATAKLLGRWTKNGWLSRIRQGVYVPVPLESRTSDVTLDDPWVVAYELFKPGYIGGWSAAGYWDLTEQIFRTIVVFTTQRPRTRQQRIQYTDILIRTIQSEALFGLKPVWRGNSKIELSDPTRTVLDMLSNPAHGGGIRTTSEVLSNYMKSDKKDLGLLLSYAEILHNGAVYKRLGFILERQSPEEEHAIAICRSRLTAGNVKLDPNLPADKLVTRWRLWVPSQWIGE